MSVKHKIQFTTFALVIAAAFGFYYIGKGGKYDDDRNIIMTVKLDATQSSNHMVSVHINGAERLTEGWEGDKWTDSMWVRPKERIVLQAHVYLRGTLTCTITDGEQTLKDVYRRDVSRWETGECAVTYVAR